MCVCVHVHVEVHKHAFCVIMHKGEHQLGTPSNTVYGVGIRHRTMP